MKHVNFAKHRSVMCMKQAKITKYKLTLLPGGHSSLELFLELREGNSEEVFSLKLQQINIDYSTVFLFCFLK